MKIDAPVNVDIMGGMKAAMLFPRRISPVVVGVASNGSNVFSIFSPTMLYAAIVLGRNVAKITNMKIIDSKPVDSNVAGIPLPV